MISLQESHSPRPSTPSEGSLVGEDERAYQDLSEDEGLAPDRPTFAGLFKQAPFKSLLYKAKLITNIGVLGGSSEPPKEPQDQTERLFTESLTEQEIVPSPQLFMDVVQH